MNILRAGLTLADYITTVSPTYAREIQTPAHGFGLDGTLRHRSADLVGILNGIDGADWNPETDGHIAAKYSARDMSGKQECKRALQREFGLPELSDQPLIAFYSKFIGQKGIQELFEPGASSVYDICSNMAAQFVVVGSGEPWCEAEVRNLSSTLPNLKAVIGGSSELLHRVIAGADFLLKPSRFEPCGKTHMLAMRYGTLPIVHRTGGLADTVRNYNQDTGNGTGFMLDDLSSRSVYDTVGWAVWAWYNRRSQVESLGLRAMAQDFSWTEPMREYQTLFETLLQRKQSERK
jgi:starch synthase